MSFFRRKHHTLRYVPPEEYVRVQEAHRLGIKTKERPVTLRVWFESRRNSGLWVWGPGEKMLGWVAPTKGKGNGWYAYTHEYAFQPVHPEGGPDMRFRVDPMFYNREYPLSPNPKRSAIGAAEELLGWLHRHDAQVLRS